MNKICLLLTALGLACTQSTLNQTSIIAANWPLLSRLVQAQCELSENFLLKENQQGTFLAVDLPWSQLVDEATDNNYYEWSKNELRKYLETYLQYAELSQSYLNSQNASDSLSQTDVGDNSELQGMLSSVISNNNQIAASMQNASNTSTNQFDLIWLPSFDDMSADEIRSQLIDNPELYETYAWYKIYFGDQGIARNYFSNASIPNSTHTNPGVATENVPSTDIKYGPKKGDTVSSGICTLELLVCAPPAILSSGSSNSNSASGTDTFSFLTAVDQEIAKQANLIQQVVNPFMSASAVTTQPSSDVLDIAMWVSQLVESELQKRSSQN